MNSKMIKLGAALGVAVAGLSLGGCVDDGYGYGGVYSASGYPYGGYYDGYYGPIYDGYWGSDQRFYYRAHENDHFHRGGGEHFYNGPTAPGQHFQQMQGNFRPSAGMHMPHFNGGGQGGGRGHR